MFLILGEIMSVKSHGLALISLQRIKRLEAFGAIQIKVNWSELNLDIFSTGHRNKLGSFCSPQHHSSSVSPTLRVPVLLPVGLDQLGEERCQILVLLLQHARRTGSAVEVHDFPRSENLKLHIVEHDLS